MPDWLALWQLFCLALMVAIPATVLYSERKGR